MVEPNIIAAALIADYCVLAAIFLYRYLRPGRGTLAMAGDAAGYYSLTAMFFFFMSVFMLSDTFLRAGGIFVIAAIPVALAGLLFALGMALVLYRSQKALLLIFALSLGIELYGAYVQPFMFQSASLSIFVLYLWYLLGIIVMYLGSKATGFMLRLAFPSRELRHEEILEESLGPDSGGRFMFMLGNHAVRAMAPSELAGLGIAYSAWMLLRFLIF